MFKIILKYKKKGTLKWLKNPSESTVKDCGASIHLKEEYAFEWKEYSKLEDSHDGTFIYLVNKIER